MSAPVILSHGVAREGLTALITLATIYTAAAGAKASRAVDNSEELLLADAAHKAALEAQSAITRAEVAPELPVQSCSGQPVQLNYVQVRHELEAVRDLVQTAQRTLSVEDYADALTGAERRLQQLIAWLALEGRAV